MTHTYQRHTWIALISVMFAGLSWVGAADAPGIRARLDQARDAQSRAASSLAPLERDLVFFANFERAGVAFLGNGSVLSLPLRPDHYAPGKFGQGYYFEKPRHNFLPPHVADVEDDVTGFTCLKGATVAGVAVGARFGKKALSASLPAQGAGIEIGPIDVLFNRQISQENAITLVASCYVKGPKGAPVRIEACFRAKEEPIPKAKPKKKGIDEEIEGIEGDQKKPDAEEEKKGEMKALLAEDVKTFPQKLVLSGDWERVACHVTGDVRTPLRRVFFKLESDGAEPVTLLLDGFQFEQAAYHPHVHLMPTMWTPGGKSLPATCATITDPRLLEAFPVRQGTMCFWTRTVRESNLRNPGATYWTHFGVSWHDPTWSVSTYRCAAGDQNFCYFKDPNATDGQWHHLALAWDEKSAVVYVDASPVGAFDRGSPDLAKLLELYHFRIGGDLCSGQVANAVMDEVAVFKRRLSDVELTTLRRAEKPLRASANSVFLTRGARSVFYRDEERAVIEVCGTGVGAATLKAPLDFALGDLLATQVDLDVRDGAGAARIEFSPAGLKCGRYACRAGVVAPEGATYVEFPIDVVPALRRDHYMLSTWGQGAATAEWRDFCKKLGLNTIDTYSVNFETLGRMGFSYGWHLNLGDGVWSPDNRAEIREQVIEQIQARAPHPNWRYTLVNSERMSLVPGEKQRGAWFDAWAENDLGFPIPKSGWKLGTTHNPIMCWLPDDGKADKEGVFKIPPAFTFLKWWYNRGSGWWRTNALLKEEIAKARPDVTVWTDPLHYPGQIADLDAGGTWCYQTDPESLIGGFEASLAVRRGSNKRFFATLGYNYVADWLTVEVPNLGKRILAPTPDDAVQQAWIAVAGLETEGLTYWCLDGLFDGVRSQKEYYCPPGSDEQLASALKNDLLPIGTMLEGVRNAQPPVALLLPESTLWVNAGEGGWGWGIHHYAEAWKRWLGNARVPYQVVLDHHVTPGFLATFKVILFPMACFVSEDVHREVTAAGQKGARIIVDAYCPRAWPNMEKLPEEYYWRMPDARRKDYGVAAMKLLTELQKELAATADVRVEGEAGPVITFVRETGGVRYIVVINNLRQPGPYTEWTKNAAFQPYGKAQAASVSVRAPAESAVYEFTQSQRLKPVVENGRLGVTLDLPPYGGRLLCAYPVELGALTVQPDAEYTRGRPAGVKIALLDARKQPVKGRQLLDVRLADPAGVEHDESGLYRMVDGEARIPFRPAVNDPPGEWKVAGTERTSGLRATTTLAVK